MTFWQKLSEVFNSFSAGDAIDIAVLFVMFSFVLYFVKSFSGLRVKIGAGVFSAVIILIVAFKAEVPVTAAVLPYAAVLVIIVFCSCFNAEIRRFFLSVFYARQGGDNAQTAELSDEELARCIIEIVRAVQNMSKNNTGALLVFPLSEVPAHILNSGTNLSAIVSAALIESIFNTSAPLHDGAIILKGNKITAAGCFLPLSQNLDLPKDLGTRHRAGLGISENINCMTIICSEETGIVSVARNGELERYCDSQILTAKLEEYYGLRVSQVRRRRRA